MLGTSPAATACQQRRHRRRSAIARRRHIPAASAMGCAESVLWKAALTAVPASPRRPPGDLAPLLRRQFLRTRPAALETALPTQLHGSGILPLIGVLGLLVGGVRDDGGSQPVQVGGALLP